MGLAAPHQEPHPRSRPFGPRTLALAPDPRKLGPSHDGLGPPRLYDPPYCLRSNKTVLMLQQRRRLSRRRTRLSRLRARRPRGSQWGRGRRRRLDDNAD